MTSFRAIVIAAVTLASATGAYLVYLIIGESVDAIPIMSTRVDGAVRTALTIGSLVLVCSVLTFTATRAVIEGQACAAERLEHAIAPERLAELVAEHLDRVRPMPTAAQVAVAVLRAQRDYVPRPDGRGYELDPNVIAIGARITERLRPRDGRE